MSEPLDLPALDEAATLLDDETPSIGALAVMRRGIKVSPELRAGLAITVVMALTAAVGRLIVPILVQLVLDNGVLSDDGYDGAYVWTVSLAALAVVLLVAAASRVALIRLVDMAETVLMNLRVRVFEHIHHLSLADHTESRRGVLVARVTSDVETLARFTQWGLISWIIDTAIIVGTIAVMLWYSWPLTLLVLVIHVPLVPFLRWVQRSQFVSYGKVRSRVAETLGHVSEAVTGAQVIRAYGYGEPVRERLDDAIERQFAQQQRSQVWFACMLPVVDVVSSISLAVAVGIGVWYGDDLGLEVGELVAFLFLVRDQIPTAPIWKAFFDDADEQGARGLYKIYTHPRPGFAYAPSSLFYGTEVANRTRVKWGAVTVARAEMRLIVSALRDPRTQRSILMSEAGVPLHRSGACTLTYSRRRSPSWRRGGPTSDEKCCTTSASKMSCTKRGGARATSGSP